eukprot:3639330-Prymnesium_polylepis.1
MLARHGQRSNGALLAAPRSRYTVCAYRACGHPLRHPWSPLWLCNTVSLELAPTEPSFGQSPNKRCRLRARLNLLLQRPRVPGWVACARCTGRLQAARRRTRATATVATTAATPSPSSTGIESGAAPASAVRARVAGAAFVAVEAAGGTPCAGSWPPFGAGGFELAAAAAAATAAALPAVTAGAGAAAAASHGGA